MRFGIEWHRMIDRDGDPCGSIRTDHDMVFNAIDTLESILAGMGRKLSFTHREIVSENPDDQAPDRFFFNHEPLDYLLGLNLTEITAYNQDMIVKAALAALEKEDL